jgi:hypothetical protein
MNRSIPLLLFALISSSFCSAQLLTNNCTQFKINTNLQLKVNGDINNTVSGVLFNDGIIISSNNFINSGTATGIGSINYSGSITNTGIIKPGNNGAGILNVTGIYNNGNSGTINMEIGGGNSTEYDQLIVNGSITCAGTLNVAFINGFLPSSGSFNLITGTTLTGIFATTNLPSGWALEYTSTTVRLKNITLGINQNDFKSNFNIYPNPFNENIFVSIDLDSKIQISNLSGKILYTNNIYKGVSKIELNNLPVGIYLMKVTNGINQTKSIKLIKK